MLISQRRRWRERIERERAFHVYVYIYAYMYTCLLKTGFYLLKKRFYLFDSACTYTYTYTYTYIYIFIYIYTYIHTYIYIYIICIYLLVYSHIHATRIWYMRYLCPPAVARTVHTARRWSLFGRLPKRMPDR